MEFWPEFLADSSGREFVAGGVGGIAGVIAGHPLETVRIRLQQPRVLPSAAPTGCISLLRHIVNTEGPLALYKGMTSPLSTIAFQNAVAFQTYAAFSRSLQGSSSVDEPLSLDRVALAGVGAGTLQTLILTPVDLIKIRLQLLTIRVPSRQPVSAPGPVDVMRDILRRDGVRGLYRGLGITMLRDAPSHAVYFGTYEFTREWLHPGCRKNCNESLLTMLHAGGLAGACSWICCYPLDVIKSRLQGQGAEIIGGSGSGAPRYNGIIDCLRKSVSEEGIKVLWRGLGTAVARAYLVNGAIFSAYEMTLRFLPPGPPQDLGLKAVDISV
jgi:solute carrier family 25 carnitine/acylcarnitine transporter 20/29